ncbi:MULTISPECIES: hypothetical protein [Okeania]|uniref:hypothetical protein n=1 Tax=Okeania TaxID=1458928 RepID=UPI000F53009C|nr:MULTISPECIES: hypothetical protein [Okeania]NET15589.1 hypothetical protein [Okeania sp. SIO1H6]NES79403.1 hypothetical protein [Okeania sp. SIO1H4]NES91526.1 hypothetical protein [Okeania sp. SIO2B9]NET23061.1 hypothetical protein [Okeania sp. SIO1H5]NET78109.1 hypothetical protein [Okeania sp. SIO1F9]
MLVQFIGLGIICVWKSQKHSNRGDYNYSKKRLYLQSLLSWYETVKSLEEGDRRQETGDRRKITYGFSPQVILNTV